MSTIRLAVVAFAALLLGACATYPGPLQGNTPASARTRPPNAT